MPRSFGITLTLAMVSLLPAASPAWPWGCEGHEVVAYFANQHLSAAAKAGVEGLIGKPTSVIKVSRFCSVQGLIPIANVSSWADDIRGSRKNTAGWHFLDIPRGTPPSTDVTQFCPQEGCVTKAITEQLAILKDPHQPSQARAEALMFIIHFVGDVHQPLHCTTNDDRGGNCVPVDFFGTHTRLDTGSTHGDWKPNLHGVWDTNILVKAMGGSGPEVYANSLGTQFASKIAGWQTGTPSDWAMESHQAADGIVYAKLPVALPTEAGDVARCDENHISDHWRGFGEHLAEPYYDAVRPLVDEQLAKAGARLAMVLNGVW
jgi:hypothetical protein